ncbi:zinc finger BED domain-containing protein RICESLEEPER 2-like [Senna tora]|uniref:Zinc finger BED domain-containing protein RICESLEEPER 2-like n=1 Tax=Senna tora TaxID=362788 RepID=A0A835CGW4_9FABA|nr:zinc finger BED domain-containing protein RICESLEEPER 2-like [Senna tora]
MARIPNRVCLTYDVWTACTSEGYICLTAHFVDENWKLRSIILNFCRMLPPHTGVELSNTILNCLKEWSLQKKVFSLTLDNASSNDNMQDILKRQLCLNEDLLCDGDYFHICCSAHILNLIVQEGLKVASDALHKIRESVKYVKASDGRMQKFDDCVCESGGIETGLGIRLDVTIRLNSTYLMLESALHYQKAFNHLNLIDRNYKYYPSIEEWRRATKMPLDSDFYEDLEVLQYWKDVQKRFSHLSIMTRDVLSIPITTVTSESAFSIGPRVLTKYRSSICPEKMMKTLLRRISQKEN